MSLENVSIVPLKDVVKRVKVGFVGSCNNDYCSSDEGVPMIRTTNLTTEGIKLENLKYINNTFHIAHKKSQLHFGDILIARHGHNGLASLWEYKFDAQCLNVVVVEPDESLANRYYLTYLINSPLIQKQIKSLTGGSVQSVINTKDIADLLIPIPSLDKQKEIADFISLFNKKISVCKSINKNLQKQINILFKSFFINFEFYDGKYQETLFGEIPIEWNIILFKDILNERNEKSTNQDIPMYSVTLDGIQPRADIYKKKITAKTTKFKIIHKYDLIFGMPNSGYQYGIMYDEIGGVSSAYPVFEINGIQPRYVDLFIKNISNYFNDIVKSGSRMGQGIDKKVLLSKEIYVPPNEHLDKYYSIESKLLDLINHNLTEINNLTKLRDTLLPKLMSGEIDVSKINCDLELKYNYMKYLFNQIHTPMSKSVV